MCRTAYVNCSRPHRDLAQAATRLHPRNSSALDGHMRCALAFKACTTEISTAKVWRENANIPQNIAKVWGETGKIPQNTAKV